jgi:formate hydrogenlyase transcriptional activator
VILSNDGVLPNPLPAAQALAVTASASASPAGTTLKDSERVLILRTLESVGWVIGGPKGAAAKLGLKRTTLIHKMEKLGISRSSHQGSSRTAEQVPQEPASLSRLQ